jgi:cell filamentation protein
MTKDPYVYPSTDILINKLDIHDAEKLKDAEALFYYVKSHQPLPQGEFDYTHLKAIHQHFFGDLYEWAGQERTIDIAKGDSYFAHQQYISQALNKLFAALKKDNHLSGLQQNEFCKKLSYYFNEINAAHPFREGNGRTQRAFCDLLAKQAGYYLDWKKVPIQEYIEASIAGFNGNYEAMENILKDITTTYSS